MSMSEDSGVGSIEKAVDWKNIEYRFLDDLE